MARARLIGEDQPGKPRIRCAPASACQTGNASIGAPGGRSSGVALDPALPDQDTGRALACRERAPLGGNVAAGWSG